VKTQIGTIGGALLAAIVLLGLPSAVGAESAPHYKNFRVAVYVVVDSTQRLAEAPTSEREFERVMSQLHFDKIYLEVYRDHHFASDAEIETVKSYFVARGVQVSGGITLAAGGRNGQFGTFDYERSEDRAECQKAVELAARHFDEVILDDFFFFTSKSDADIAAKGARSWTQYRLDTMRSVAKDLVLGRARAVNPRIRLIVKYPNWYEHFQGLGYDLEQESQQFDAIYTGTETRDPYVTDQLLQQYESYEIYRYFSNIRPGANLGGWVDTFDTRYVDRYAEQLWDTLLAKAPEITLFNWEAMSQTEPVRPGERSAWSLEPTSFRWDEMVAGYTPVHKDAGPGWGRVAAYSLEKIDAILGQLGHPIGLASYKPYQSTGEDYLHNYLGNIGIPIELRPTFPTDASIVLLTESAKSDPQIVAKIKSQLVAGKTVVITSGLLGALQGKGIEDIAEIGLTGRVAALHDFINGFGAGRGTRLDDPAEDTAAVLFPEIRFLTNDSWPIIRGVAGAKGFPVMLMNRYSRGLFMVLAIPENIGDLYSLPSALLSQIRTYLMPDFPVRLEGPAQISVFAYDNNTFVLQSFRPETSALVISTPGTNLKLRDLGTGELVEALHQTALPVAAAGAPRRRFTEPPRTSFKVSLKAHSFHAYRVEP
jgi:hypothetical protein